MTSSSELTPRTETSPDVSSDRFHRSMGVMSTFALGFTYLSPLVGIYSLFVFGLTLAGPSAMWWIPIVAVGQLLVALVFGEVVSQYPITGGIYPWARRLWGPKYAWLAGWIYLWALVVTAASVAVYSSDFVASLFGFHSTDLTTLVTGVVLLLLTFGINVSGTRMLGRVARAGLFAELIGVVALGIYLLLFERHNPFSVLFSTLGAVGAEGTVLPGFLVASLVGLWMFYGFEACGDVAEEVSNPGRAIPRAMIMTVVIGAISAVIAYAGYVLAAPNLTDIVAGNVENPIADILRQSLGNIGMKVFLCVALLSFISGLLSLQAALSRLLYSFGRDNMLPASSWLSRLSSEHAVPQNAMVVTCMAPLAICVIVYLMPGSLSRVTAFAVVGIYVCFQMVVLAALRQRMKGWRPGGVWTLGRLGLPITCLALVWGVLGIVVLSWPGARDLMFLDRWIVLIGLFAVVALGATYMVLKRPYLRLNGPSGDAVAVADQMRADRAQETA
ncbi:amino acid permease [soil metagenome]